MRNVVKLLLMLPLVCLGSMTLDEAYKRIPKIAEDQKNVVEVVWDMPQTNIVKYLEVVRKAFKTYPTSESNRTNMYVRLDYWVNEATNNHPTVELLAPWVTQLPQEVRLKMLNSENNKVRSANGINPGSPIYDFDVITMPNENVPVNRAWINGGWQKAKKDLKDAEMQKKYNPCECNPYKGQVLGTW